MEKVAGRSYHKEIVKLVQEGNYAAANAKIKQLLQAGNLRITPQGSQAKILAAGSEGPATIVYGAKDNPYISVRKAFNTEGPLYNKEMLSEKVNTWRRAQNAGDPRLARLYSKGLRKGKGGTPYYIMEHINDDGLRNGIYTKAGPTRAEIGTESVAPILKQTKTTFRPQGPQKPPSIFSRIKDYFSSAPKPRKKILLGDSIGNKGNTMSSGGQQKIIDFIPVQEESAVAHSMGKGEQTQKYREFVRNASQRVRDKISWDSNPYKRMRIAANFSDKYGFRIGADNLKKHYNTSSQEFTNQALRRL